MQEFDDSFDDRELLVTDLEPYIEGIDHFAPDILPRDFQ